MIYGLYDSKVELEEKVSATSGFRSQKVVDVGPIMLDAERCVHCSRCIRFEREVTGTNLMEFRWRADHMEIATFEDRPITHDYAGNRGLPGRGSPLSRLALQAVQAPRPRGAASSLRARRAILR